MHTHMNHIPCLPTVVYSNPLTDEFFRTVLRLMTDPPDKTMYIALEKR